MTNYWQEFIALGGSLVMIPAAMAIFTWLSAGGAWGMAWLWGVLFSVGLAIVAATQIAFIGWGVTISALDFQGFSGHSMRTAAVMPLLFYLILQHASRSLRMSGVLFGILFAAMMGFAVSVHNTHSASESIGGCALGYAISLGFIALSRPMKQPALDHSVAVTIGFGVVAAIIGTTTLMTDRTYGWMTHIACSLSGTEKPYAREF